MKPKKGLVDMYVRFSKKRVMRTTAGTISTTGSKIPQIIADFDKDDKLVGVEILNAKGLKINGKKVFGI